MITAITVFLTFLATYFGIGLLFGIYFLIKSAPKIDPILGDSKWKVRVLLFPGVIVTWPFFIGKLFKSKTS